MKRIFIILVLVLYSVLPSMGQEEVIKTRQQTFFMVGTNFQMWKSQEYVRPINQFSFPMTLLLPFGDRFNLTIIHSPAYAWWDQNYSLGGFSDTWINGAYVIWNERLMFSLGLGAPTGKTRLTNTEFELTQRWLSKNVLRYRMPVYGQGFCTKIGTALAVPIGTQVIFGCGGQYIYHASYVPVEYQYMVADEMRIADDEFQPGNETNLHFGMDVTPHENMKLMFDVIYTVYGRDVFDEIEVYGSGQKWTVDFGLFYRFRQHFIWSHLQFRQKGKNELLQGLAIVEEIQNSNGTQVDADVMGKIYNYQNGGLFALLDGRFYGKNEAGLGGATIVGLGTGGEFQISDITKVNFHFKYLVGYLFDNDDDVRIEGMDTFVGFTFNL